MLRTHACLVCSTAQERSLDRCVVETQASGFVEYMLLMWCLPVLVMQPCTATRHGGWTTLTSRALATSPTPTASTSTSAGEGLRSLAVCGQFASHTPWPCIQARAQLRALLPRVQRCRRQELCDFSGCLHRPEVHGHSGGRQPWLPRAYQQRERPG